jgi:hypothetical protein
LIVAGRDEPGAAGPRADGPVGGRRARHHSHLRPRPRARGRQPAHTTLPATEVTYTIIIVLVLRIRVRIRRIHMLLGLPDLDPLVRKTLIPTVL